MGGVVSVSGKNSLCRHRVSLAILAIQQQEAFANAQKNYNALQDKMGAAIDEFVGAHCSLRPDSDELQDAVHLEEEKEEQHDEKDSSIVTDKANTSKNEDSRTAKEKTKKGNKKRDVNASAGSSTAKKEDENVEQHPAESHEKRFSEVKDQFEKVGKSGTMVCKSLDNNCVETGKQHKSIFGRSATRSRSTRGFGFPRSMSVRVGETAEAPKHCSTLVELHAREKSLERQVEIVELEKKNGRDIDVSVAKRMAGKAFQEIEQLRDGDLETHLSGLLKSLQESLKSMSKCHEIQYEIMAEKSLFNKPHEKDNARTATVKLQTELQNWCAAFTSYLCAQKSYIKSLHEWSRESLPSSLFVEEKPKKGENSEKVENTEKVNKCTKLLGDWLSCLEKLEDKEVSKTMSEFDKELTNLRKQQNKEQECKKRVDKLNEDILEETLKSTKKKKNMKKDKELNGLKTRLENENKAYESSKTQKQNIVTNVIQERFALIFESLAKFTTKASQDYAEVAKKHTL